MEVEFDLELELKAIFLCKSSDKITCFSINKSENANSFYRRYTINMISNKNIKSCSNKGK